MTTTPKQDVRDLLDRLPDDVSMEQIVYHALVIPRVRAGLEDVQRVVIARSLLERELVYP